MACNSGCSGPFDSRASTILLVDDEKNVTRGLATLLHRSSLTVLEAHSGAEALAVLRRWKVDVVVSDEQMPGMTGSEFLAVVSREFPDTGRVILTGQATVDAAARAINEGKVCQFLQKPCTPITFRAAVEEALRAATQAKLNARLMDVARREGLDPWATQADAPKTAPMRNDAFAPELLSALSARELEIFNLVVDGLRLSQIAGALFISPHTARNHLKAIFRKLDVHSQTDMLNRSRGLSERPRH